MDKKPERKPLPSLDFLFFIGKEIERHIQSHTRANSLPPLTNAHAHGLVSLTLSQQKPKPTLPLLSLPFKCADAAASSRSRFASSFQLLSSLLLLPPASFAVVSRTR
ncbi:hypothetical protein WN944_026025 [Citrus x changshan-huyou]|uniref:Uncharacterized protein n=1 Tax=Citrus x changshan-huyou TaxID=2935761 RepID=A0AAP0LSA2_9ROSI